MGVEKIDQKRFLKMLSDDGYSTTILFDLFESGIIDSSDVRQFNESIQNIHEKHGIKFFDMFVYLENIFSDYKKMICLLDEKTTRLLAEEIAETYHIKKPKSKFEELE